MQTFAQLVHQAHCGRWHKAQRFRKKAYTFGQKDQQLSKSLVFLHGLTLYFFELDFEQSLVFLYVLLVEDGVTGHLDGNFFELFEKGIVGRFFVLLLHRKLKIIINDYIKILFLNTFINSLFYIEN